METPTELSARVAAKIIGILAVLVIFVCFGLWVYGMQRKVEKLEDAKIVTTANATASKTQATGYATYIKEKEEVDARTQTTLEANSDYSDGYVPADVADLLREPARP